MSVLDLSMMKEATADTATLNILHPKTGVDTGIRIVVASVDSPKYRKAASIVNNRNASLFRKGKNNLSIEAINEGATDLLVAAVVSWDGVIWGGQEMDCTDANIRQVYELFPWIKEQVDEFVSDRGNFINA